MDYIVVESRLKTDKPRTYIWNKINTPKKIVKIEEFDENAKIKKISENTYELLSEEYHVLLTFIFARGVNQTFINKKNFPLTWFEIKGEQNCTIIHGEYKRKDPSMSRENLQKEIEEVKRHFMRELEEIAS
ncbi:hypothetical protein CMO92_00395 [Candidatus Woesearchaeota archaeon]|nr:hypothetical protein [Candidatus Woesearchaeota archaeon]|tara:strand:+ start:262 stop:654 length:393 start_codon:yes stop_codon:yes gene_type:complete